MPVTQINPTIKENKQKSSIAQASKYNKPQSNIHQASHDNTASKGGVLGLPVSDKNCTNKGRGFARAQPPPPLRPLPPSPSSFPSLYLYLSVNSYQKYKAFFNLISAHEFKRKREKEGGSSGLYRGRLAVGWVARSRSREVTRGYRASVRREGDERSTE